MTDESSRSGFRPVEPRHDAPEVRIGMLGYNFMAKAHSNAYRTIPYIYWPPPARPVLRAIAGRSLAKVAEAAERYGFEGSYTSWEELVEDPDIDVVDNCASHHMHVEPSIAALRNGKHVLCEKPLALSAADALRMVETARASGRQHMTGFNYRFVPAVRLAHDLIQRGLLGEIYHVRMQYLQQSLHDPDRPLGRVPEGASRRVGSQLNLGSHVSDLARFLAGELATVSALTPRFRDARPSADGSMVELEWDDASVALVEFASGAVGTLEATRLATGCANALRFEINGSRGSVGFDLERLNELRVHLADAPVADVVGFQDVLVTGAGHPFSTVWWPNGHILGWEHAHINEIAHFLGAVTGNNPVAPLGATFEDGYRAAVIAEAIEQAAREGRRIDLAYADAGT